MKYTYMLLLLSFFLVSLGADEYYTVPEPVFDGAFLYMHRIEQFGDHYYSLSIKYDPKEKRAWHLSGPSLIIPREGMVTLENGDLMIDSHLFKRIENQYDLFLPLLKEFFVPSNALFQMNLRRELSIDICRDIVEQVMEDFELTEVEGTFGTMDDLMELLQ